MVTASEIIKRCGGFKVVADWLGLDRSAINRWTYDRSRNGTCERIPVKHWAPLIAKAAENGITITIDELVPIEAARAADEAAA